MLHKTKKSKAKTQHNTCWIPPRANKHIQPKEDMGPSTNKTWALLQIRHGPFYKQDMGPSTNKTWALLQTKHGPFYKQLNVQAVKHLVCFLNLAVLRCYIYLFHINACICGSGHDMAVLLSIDAMVFFPKMMTERKNQYNQIC